MVKTAIENHQNLVVDGCYISFDWQKDFDENYLKDIYCSCLVLTENYIQTHFDDIKLHASSIESRLDDSWCTMDSVLKENAHNFEMCKKFGCDMILIDECYQVDIGEINV